MSVNWKKINTHKQYNVTEVPNELIDLEKW